MTSQFTVVFADDKAADDSARIKATMARVLARFAPRRELVWEPFSDREHALTRLQESGGVTLALIDAYWPSITGNEQNSANDLLRAAHARPETVVVLVSSSPATLLHFLYDDDSRLIRPHAVLLKDHANHESVVSGVLEAAFGSSLCALRSPGLEFVWPETRHLDAAYTAHVRKVFEELTAQADPDGARFEMAPIGGGLSDTLTCLVTASPRDTTRGGVKEVLIKASLDPATLTTELENHKRFVASFPARTFAHLASPHEGSYAGWSSLVFEQIRGRTLASLPTATERAASFGVLFSNSMRRAYGANCTPGELDAGAWMTGPDGLLGNDRVARAEAAADELRAVRPTIPIRSVSEIFSRVRRLSYFGLMHGDLHARNALVDEDGHVALVDAASMRSAGLWCEDLARLTVWLAAEIVGASSSGSSSEQVSELQAALALIDTQPSDSDLVNLRCAAVEARDAIAALLLEKHSSAANASHDWSDVARAELLRVAYSEGSFTVNARAIAIETALTD